MKKKKKITLHLSVKKKLSTGSKIINITNTQNIHCY